MGSEHIQLARCRMCHSQRQRQTQWQRRPNGLDHSNFAHEHFQLFVVLIIAFAMCICSIAFDDEWVTRWMSAGNSRHATVICKRIQLRVLILWLFTFPTRCHPNQHLKMTDTKHFFFYDQRESISHFISFSGWNVCCVDERWWSRLILLVDKTQRHKNGK